VEPLTAVVAGVLGVALGLLVPRLVALVPEPEADPEADPEHPKEPYTDIAARPGLAWRCAVVGGLSAACVGLVVGWSWALLVVLPLIPVSLALAVIDWRTRLLPSWLIRRAYLLAVVTVLVSWLVVLAPEPAPLIRALIGAAAAGGLYFVLWFVYPSGMGYGDVRLSGVLGLVLAYLGWSELVVGIYGGFLLGGVIGGLLSLLRRVDRKGYPFGPFMLLGALVGVVLGQPVMDALIA
jgi:leader peptidase (prepilin peptidase) / N-methyltransferase